MRTPLFLSVVAFTTVATAYAATGVTAPAPSAAPSNTPAVMPSAPTPPPMPVMNAAPTPATSAQANAAKTAGQYNPVACTSNPAFATNSCNQCFEGTVKVGERLVGLYDNWSNTNSGTQVAYRDEQKMPEMVKLDPTSKWTSSPADEAKIWKFSTEVQWVTTGSGGRAQFMNLPGSNVRFIEAEMGAGYTLESTSKKNGEVVGLLRLPVVYRNIDTKTVSEGPAVTQYECVAYTLSAPAPAVTPITPPKPTTPTPPKTPTNATKVETGPESLLLIAAAFFIAFGLMFSLRKRV